MPRLLKCHDCLSLEVLPDWLGPKADERYDPLLNRLVDRHVGPLNREQLHRRPSNAPRVRELRPNERHRGDLFAIPPDDWADDEKRNQVIKRIWHNHTGYPDEFYAAKDTFGEDAGICFNRHGRPGSDKGPAGCGDYKDDSKRLTDGQWQRRGRRMGLEREHVYLCDFCPYSSIVITKKRIQRGDYD